MVIIVTSPCSARFYTRRMHSDYQQALGKVITDKREAAGLSKKQFSLMVGVNRLTLRRIEEGNNNSTLDTLLRISRGLGVSYADLVVETERTLVGKHAEQSGGLLQYSPIESPLQIELGEPSISYFLTRF